MRTSYGGRSLLRYTISLQNAIKLRVFMVFIHFSQLEFDPDRTDAGFRLRLHYLRLLYPFERVDFLGLDDDVNLEFEQHLTKTHKSSNVYTPSLSPRLLLFFVFISFELSIFHARSKCLHGCPFLIFDKHFL